MFQILKFNKSDFINILVNKSSAYSLSTNKLKLFIFINFP